MQDFQEVIEDSQLINAMYDDTPKPTEQWFSASLDEVEVYHSHLENYSPEELKLPFICNTSLGFYLFTKFLRVEKYEVYAYFLIDCARYRCATATKRQRIASEIKSKYLAKPQNESQIKWMKKFPSSLARNRFISAPDSVTESEEVTREVESTSESHTSDWTLDKSSPPINALNVTGGLIDALMARINENTALEDFDPTLFDELDDAVFSLVSVKENDFKESVYYKKFVDVRIQLKKPVVYKDFQLFRTLGRGGFGLVNGCKKVQSGQLYAMKALCRKRIKLKKAAELCLNEKYILEMINSPFIVCMQYAFTTPQDIYIVLDLMVGGDLGFYLHRAGCFDMSETKYFVARTILGLKALHDCRVVYRDLKPENILMDSKGRTKLSDLGLACKVPDKRGLAGTYGTRGYWAPEMLKRDADGHRLRYGCEVDWFSLGCVTYEFIVGVCPFKTDAARKWNSKGGRGAAGMSTTIANRSSTANKSEKKPAKSKARTELEERIDAAVLEMNPDFSDSRFTPESISFCEALLSKDPNARLGIGGADEVMQHPFFSELSWDEIISDEMQPPTQPRRDLNMATQDEIGTFSDAKLAKKVELTKEDLDVFLNWDYVRPDALYDEAVKFMTYEEEHGKIVVKDNSGFCCTVS